MSEIDYQDDASLALPLPDALILWRRVPADKKIFDENLARTRPTSDAFCDHRDGSSMSVYDSETCGGAETIMQGHDGFLLCSFTVAEAKSKNLCVVRTSKGGPGHCEVVGKKTSSVKDKLAKLAVWVIGP